MNGRDTDKTHPRSRGLDNRPDYPDYPNHYSDYYMPKFILITLTLVNRFISYSRKRHFTRFRAIGWDHVHLSLDRLDLKLGKSMTSRTYCPAALDVRSISTAPENRHIRSLSKSSTAPSFFRAGLDSSRGASPRTMAACTVPYRPAKPIGISTTFVDVSRSQFPNLNTLVSLSNSG